MMHPVWSEDMRDLVELFVRRGLITRPAPLTTEQALALHQSSVRNYEAAKKRASRTKRAFKKQHVHE